MHFIPPPLDLVYSPLMYNNKKKSFSCCRYHGCRLISWSSLQNSLNAELPQNRRSNTASYPGMTPILPFAASALPTRQLSKHRYSLSTCKPLISARSPYTQLDVGSCSLCSRSLRRAASGAASNKAPPGSTLGARGMQTRVVHSPVSLCTVDDSLRAA